MRPRVERELARVVEPEDVQRATEREPAADAHREVEDLGIGERRGAHARVERVVDRVVVEREQLGVLDREPFAFRVAVVRTPVEHVGVVVFRHRALGAGRRAPLLADHAAVDLGDTHAGQLALAYRQDALFVDRVAQRARTHPHLRPQRPHAYLGIGLAFGNGDVRHYSTPNSAHGLSHAMRRISVSVRPSEYRPSA